MPQSSGAALFLYSNCVLFSFHCISLHSLFLSLFADLSQTSYWIMDTIPYYTAEQKQNRNFKLSVLFPNYTDNSESFQLLSLRDKLKSYRPPLFVLFVPLAVSFLFFSITETADEWTLAQQEMHSVSLLSFHFSFCLVISGTWSFKRCSESEGGGAFFPNILLNFFL